VDSKLGLRDLDSWRAFYFSLFWACGLLVGLLLLFSSNNLLYFTLKINKNTQWRNPLISQIFVPKHGMKIKYRARLSQNHKLCIIMILICNPRHERITTSPDVRHKEQAALMHTQHLGSYDYHLYQQRSGDAYATAG
jgi:hypothetical protein